MIWVDDISYDEQIEINDSTESDEQEDQGNDKKVTYYYDLNFLQKLKKRPHGVKPKGAHGRVPRSRRGIASIGKN